MRRIVHTRPREESVLRCALCHDELQSAAPCGGCGTLLHPDCRSSVSACPTRGCRGEPIVLRAPEPQGAGSPFLLVGIAWGVIGPGLWWWWPQGQGSIFDSAMLGMTWVAVGIALSGIALDAIAARLHRWRG